MAVGSAVLGARPVKDVFRGGRGAAASIPVEDLGAALHGARVEVMALQLEGWLWNTRKLARALFAD